MTCERCSCHFCFRCGARLNHKDPVSLAHYLIRACILMSSSNRQYGHYSTPGLPCYNRLFDIQPSAENQWDEALIQQFAEFDD
jgi:E3 ubiquitin-protein ligase RNF14